MRNGDWHHGHGHWMMMFPMLLVMVAVIGGLIWLGLSMSRRSHGAAAAPAHGSGSTPAMAKSTPQEILAERLARGEIEPDDYRRRLDVLENRPPG